MSYILALIPMLLGLIAGIGHVAEVAPVGIQVIGPEKPTSFPKLLLIHITNPAYTAFPLAQMMAASELIVDGQSFKRKPAPFRGPAGIPAIGEWDGCVSVEDYAATIPPGKHKLSFKLGKTVAQPIPVKWSAPLDWRTGNMKSRLKEIKELALVIVDGLPQGCVEQWLTVKDGGQQEEDKVRYYLQPQFKMVVPYRQMYEQSGMHAVVDGPPKFYEEQHLTD